MLTLTTQIFGVQGYFGDLKIKPQIGDFLFDDQNQVNISLPFQDLKLNITFERKNTTNLVHKLVENVKINGQQMNFLKTDEGIILPYSILFQHATNDKACEIIVELAD